MLLLDGNRMDMKTTKAVFGILTITMALLHAHTLAIFGQAAYQEKEVYMRTTAPQGIVRDAVFLIERTNRLKGTLEPHASGFYIGFDGMFYGVTARHVVQQRGTKWGDWGDLIKPLYIRNRPVQADLPSSLMNREMGVIPYENLYIVHTNNTLDVVVFPCLTVTSQTLTNAPDRATAISLNMVQCDDSVVVGEDVNIFGFPGPYGFDRGEAVVRSGTICYKVNQYAYLLDANLWPGDSGGMICSKPYFGVPKDDFKKYQWHFGGKVLGLYHGWVNPAAFGLPKELHAFQIIYSGQAIKEIFDSAAFKQKHKEVKALIEKH